MSVITTVPFYLPPTNGEKAFIHINADTQTGKRTANYDFVSKKVEVENIRGKEREYNLDTAGFQLVRSAAKHTDFSDDGAIEREYYPESTELIKSITGASKVVIFDHTIRRRNPDQFDDAPNKRQPVSNAHVDQTPKSARDRVYRHVAEKADELVKHRFQIINLWRAIENPAVDWPLALCDFRSVQAEKDVVPVTLIYPERTGETYGVRFNPEHKWKYFHGATPEEAILIKCYDSDESVALFTPHTGFEDPTTPSDAPKRQSIELRALVFYEN